MDDMNSEYSLFDLLPEEEAARFKPLKSDDWKWTFADYPKEKNGLKVFSCFACGGGSTMGYKLAGCEVLGCCEIDPKMNGIYIANHHPKHNFLMDIRDFNNIPNEELPEELFDIDILDGSPPCTTFSMAGLREENWGKEKVFREGQKMQTLDDLSFIFIDTVKKLKPRVVVIENVEGLIRGEAFGYVRKIYDQLEDAGYKVNHWLLKGENMGVPQMRHRVFFVACRNDLGIDPDAINMAFNYEPVLMRDIVGGEPKAMNKTSQQYKMLQKAQENIDHSIKDVLVRECGKYTCFTDVITWLNEVPPTQTGKGNIMVGNDCRRITMLEAMRMQTFPEDYDFGTQRVSYVCGMSVPPVMMKRIVTRLIKEGVFKYKGVS